MASDMERLSDDVLLEIFSLLDARSLKYASLVCRNWNDIISLSPSTMKKFHLKLSNRNVMGENMSWVDKFDEIMQLERKHQSMTVFLHSSDCKQVGMIIDILARNGTQVRSLTLNDSELNTKDFCAFLENLPLLEELELNRVSIKAAAPSCIQPVTLKKLKMIKVNSSSWCLFDGFIGPQIKNLRVVSKMVRITDRQSMIKFMESSEKLETIEIDSRVFVHLFQTKFENKFSFALKWIKFPWHFPQTEVGEADENFISFLEDQASSLEELELNYVASKLIETILVKMKALKKLRVNATALPENTNFYSKFKPQMSIKELKAHDKFSSPEAMIGLLALLPSLESLVMIHEQILIASSLELLSRLNTKLKRLSLETLDFDISSDVNLKFLKFLHLERITSMGFVLHFLQLHQSVDTLSIKLSEEDSATDIVNALFDQTTLIHFQFIGDFKQMQEIYKLVKVDHRSLRTLKLTITSDCNAGPKISFFELPRDGTKWNPKEENWWENTK